MSRRCVGGPCDGITVDSDHTFLVIAVIDTQGIAEPITDDTIALTYDKYGIIPPALPHTVAHYTRNGDEYIWEPAHVE